MACLLTGVNALTYKYRVLHQHPSPKVHAPVQPLRYSFSTGAARGDFIPKGYLTTFEALWVVAGMRHTDRYHTMNYKSHPALSVITVNVEKLCFRSRRYKEQRNMLKDMRGCNKQKPGCGKLQDKWPGFSHK
jgi:hypothetical protein